MNSTKTFFQVLELGPTDSKRRFLKLGVLHVLISFADLFSIAFLVSLMAAAIKSDRAQLLQNYLLNDWDIPLSHERLLLGMALTSLVLFACKNLLAYRVAKRSLGFAENFSAHLSERLVNAFYQRGFSFLRNEKIFKITHRTSSMPFEFASVTLKSVFGLFAQIAMCLAFLIFSLVLDPTIALALVVGALPAIAFMYFKHRKKSIQFGKEKNEKLPSNNRALHKLYESFIELKVYGAKDLFIEKFLFHLNGFNAVRFKQQLLTIYPRRILETVAISLIVLLFSYRLFMNGGPDAFLIDLLVLGVFAYKVIPALANIMDAAVVLNTTKDAQKTLIHNLANFGNDVTSTRSQEIKGFESLQLSKIAYKYESNEVLKDLNLLVSKGAIIGIVGRSGEGKSTLLKILMGLLSPSLGSIQLNGIPTEIHNNDAWFQHLGFADADSSLLDASIYENVSLGAPLDGNNKKKVEDALRSVELQDFIGNDRNVGENGKALSSGQKQRVALARALFHRPSVLVLDEFTSFLDEETEHHILNMIRKLHREHGMTIILVSHRKSTTEIASQVFELSRKKLVQVR